MDIKKLQKLLKTEYGKPFKEFLFSYYKKLSHINSIRDVENVESQMVEIKAHKKAINLIEEMINQLASIEDFKEQKKGDKDSVIID